MKTPTTLYIRDNTGALMEQAAEAAGFDLEETGKRIELIEFALKFFIMFHEEYFRDKRPAEPPTTRKEP